MATGYEVSAGQGSRQPVLDSYARLSRNPSGQLEKIDTQHADNREVIARLGGVLGEEIADDSLSAWDPNVHRPGWERQLKRIAARACDGVVIWNTDRAMRLMIDLEHLFLVVGNDDGFILGSSHGRYNLSDYNDRHQLRNDVSHNQRSSDEASHRIKRRFDVLRRRGVLHQPGRSFGFPGLDRTVSRRDALDDDGNDTREPVPAVLVERERAALRAATANILAGGKQSLIADEWNAAGLLTSTGTLWTSAKVKTMLLRPRNAGLIEYDGEVVGKMPGEPIIDPKDFERLRALYAGRNPGRQAGERYLVSGIGRCPRCEKKLSGRPHVGKYPDGDKRRQYACTKARGGCGKVAADALSVNREVRGLVIARLSDVKFAAAINAARARISDRLAAVQAEIADCEARQEAIAEKYGLRKLTDKAFDKANEPLIADLTRLKAERDEMTGGDPEGPTKAMSKDEVAAKWDAGDTGNQRAMLIEALGRDTLYVYPSEQKGFRTFDPERVRIKPHDDAAVRR